MLGQLSFTLPLLIILVLETAVGALLLCPKPFNQPSIALARATHTQIGATVFYTLAGVLTLLMASPLYDATQLYHATRDKTDAVAAALDTTCERESFVNSCVFVGLAAAAADAPVAQPAAEHEARTLLSFTLTAACLAQMFFLRRLGAVLGQLERMSVSEAAMLKQVKGLQSEYARMAGSAGAAGGTAEEAAAQPSGPPGAGRLSDDEVGELRRLVADLERMNSELGARLEKANKAHSLAESNLSALKTQSKGLENEYDRLLSEHDELRRQLQRAGLAAGGAADSRMGKKDE
ncbi:hypothetical protein CHLNCDRAFT_142489 [Chlorella variabilis]|uniref:Endoplasmic reticulum transmembrane protein n=1 Tax=Chlorella variabilis TaxID=554065 RepID=E1ZTR7_CHLVA|nr:hypothetical protein CHLNCDRAFT_142489 [Chlorella variabilis]EFN50774.1 hypothetical protein CHLNCDRAFT_142489 [Chlorella variabilis]|eukprot:XP_005842886.1 hypothetical protein CHLNCDRAFT_142489 [Chlorella variabilis]